MAKPWENDGPRFVASLQDVTDPQCYKDFFESQKLSEAKEKADDASAKYNRSTLVFDREQSGIVYKKVIEQEKKEPDKKVPPPRRGRRKIERKIEIPKKKLITKDDYF